MKHKKKLKSRLEVLKKSFTFRRALNYLLLIISYNLSRLLKRPFVWGYPPIITIEPTNLCNLQCPICIAGNNKMKRERGYMSFEDYKNFIDQLEKYIFSVAFIGYGEPFLNPDIYRMIEYANKKKLFLFASSNGNIKINSCDLVKNSFDNLVIALDGTTQKTYSEYRVNGNIEVVMENIKNIIKEKENKHSSKPHMTMQFLVMKHNEHELEKIEKLSEDLGFDSFVIKTVGTNSEAEKEKFQPTNPKFIRTSETDNNSDKKKGCCRNIFFEPVINWDGDLSICCYDSDNIVKVGKITEQKSFLQIWKSDKIMQIRKSMLTDNKIIELCNNCGVRKKIKLFR